MKTLGPISVIDWKVVRNPMGVAVGIQSGDYMVVKEHMFGEDQYFVTHGKKLVTVANEPEVAKQACEPKEPVPELDFSTFADMQR